MKNVKIKLKTWIIWNLETLECSSSLTFWILAFYQFKKKINNGWGYLRHMCLELTITLKFIYFKDIWGPQSGCCLMLRKQQCVRHIKLLLSESTQLRHRLRSQNHYTPRWWVLQEGAMEMKEILTYSSQGIKEWPVLLRLSEVLMIICWRWVWGHQVREKPGRRAL